MLLATGAAVLVLVVGQNIADLVRKEHGEEQVPAQSRLILGQLSAFLRVD